jgi:ADP-ribose pyrophosphatase YjhB (NUDIX family)
MKKSDNPWQTLDSKIVYQNPWMKVYEDKVRMPNGKEGIYGFIEGKPGIFIIALTDDDKIYLIESFRYPTKKWQWELPTGGIEKGISSLESAKSELAEELGMTAERWTQINTYAPTHNGLMKDFQDVFIAEKLHAGKEHREDLEAIRAVKSRTLKEIMAMIKDGSFADGQSLAALMQFVAWRGVHGL